MDCPEFAMIASNTDPQWFVFMFLPVDELKRLATCAGWDAAWPCISAEIQALPELNWNAPRVL